MKNKLLEEILIALSVSNLLFITSWRRLIYPTSEAYHIKLEPYALDYLGIIISVLLTATFFLGGVHLLRLILKDKAAFIINWIFLAVFLIILNGFRIQFYQSESSFYAKIAIFAAIALFGIFVLLKLRRFIFPTVRSIALILSPFVLITFSQAIWGTITANPQTETSIPTQLSRIQTKDKPNIKNRVIWIIFDELDYFVPFETSPLMIDLPEFTKLKNESLFAKTVSPAYTTLESIPSMFTGKKVVKGETLNKSELMLKFEDEETAAKFSETPNIFRNIKQMQGETAIIGWYHSYCRVIGNDLSACHWESFDTINDFENQTLSRILAKDFLRVLISLPFGFRFYEKVNSYFEANIEDKGYVQRHNRMIEGAKEVVSQPQIDLALIHLPIPHSPSYYNRSTGKFGGVSTTYLDNLALTDIVLGEIRQTLETKNLWENSTIIVSSDHQWRLNQYKLSQSNIDFPITKGIEHPNIPFFLKLKGQKESLNYEKTFNTVITHDLILTLLKGEISTTKDVKNWLDKNSDR